MHNVCNIADSGLQLVFNQHTHVNWDATTYIIQTPVNGYMTVMALAISRFMPVDESWESQNLLSSVCLYLSAANASQLSADIRLMSRNRGFHVQTSALCNWSIWDVGKCFLVLHNNESSAVGSDLAHEVLNVLFQSCHPVFCREKTFKNINPPQVCNFCPYSPGLVSLFKNSRIS